MTHAAKCHRGHTVMRGLEPKADRARPFVEKHKEIKSTGGSSVTIPRILGSAASFHSVRTEKMKDKKGGHLAKGDQYFHPSVRKNLITS